MTRHKELLTQISAASKVLNDAADAASDTISSIEKKLLEAEPGTTVWQQVLLEDETTYCAEGEAEEAPALRRVTLGFAKVKGKWGIAVREDFLGKKKPRDAAFTELLGQELTLLRKADRDLRILAMPLIDSLLETLLETIKARVERLYPSAPEGEVDDSAAEAVVLSETSTVIAS